GHVVELAKHGLKLLQCAVEALERFPAAESVGQVVEELPRISKLLDRYSHLMPLAGIHCIKLLDLLDYLVPPPRQFLRGEIDNGTSAQRGGERILMRQPFTAEQPECRLQHDVSISIALDRGTGFGETFTTLLHEVRLQNLEF